MFGSDPNCFPLIDIQQQQRQLLLNMNNQIISSDPMEGTEEEGQHIVEGLKSKERRKCNDLLAEFVAQLLVAPTPSEHGGPLSSPTELLALSIPSSSPASSTSISSSASSPVQMWPIGEQKGAGGKRREQETGDQRPKGGGAERERAHKCEECGKAFRFKSNLFEHKSLHLGSAHRNPFVCPFCSKTCRLKGNLKKHLQVHVTSVEDLERLWKRSFSRNSGRPRKNAPHAPLPKPGDDLGLVPVVVHQRPFQPLQSASSSSSSSSSGATSSYLGPATIKWTIPDQPLAYPKMAMDADVPDPKLSLISPIAPPMHLFAATAAEGNANRFD